MSKSAGFGDGSRLPPRVQRVLEREAAHDRAEARRAEIDRAERVAAREIDALAACVAAAESRGEYVTARQIATGKIPGRTPEEIMRAGFSAQDRADALAGHRERRGDGDWEFIGTGEPVIHEPVSRAEIVNDYELSRTLRQVEDSRDWMNRYKSRLASRQGRAAEHLEARRAEAEARHLQRSQPTPVLTSRTEAAGYTEITRVCTADGMGQLGDIDGNVIAR